MKRILIAVDGSKRSVHALRWAKHLADEIDIAATAVAVAGPGAHLAMDTPVGLTAAEENLAVVAALEKLIADAGLAGVDATVMRGRAADALHDAATSPGVVALVMGTRGLGTIPGLLLGSLSRRMLFDCASPLLLVPDRGVEQLPLLDNVLVGIDGSPISRAIVAWSAQLCALLGSRVTVLRCIDPGAELPPGHVERYLDDAASLMEREWCAPLQEAAVQYEVLTVRGDPRRHLLDVADDRSAGLLIVAGRGEGQFQGLGGTTSYLVRHSPIPLAVLPCDPAWQPEL